MVWVYCHKKLQNKQKTDKEKRGGQGRGSPKPSLYVFLCLEVCLCSPFFCLFVCFEENLQNSITDSCSSLRSPARILNFNPSSKVLAFLLHFVIFAFNRAFFHQQIISDDFEGNGIQMVLCATFCHNLSSLTMCGSLSCSHNFASVIQVFERVNFPGLHRRT